MNVQQLFPHLGKVITGTGSRHFARLLHDLISASLHVDATHVSQHRTRLVEVAAGASAPVSMDKDSSQDALPQGSQQRLEPVLLSVDQVANARVDKSIKFGTPAYDAQDIENPCEDHSEVPQVHLASHSNGQRCVISVYRSSSSKPFTSQERAQLKDMSWMLLPIVEEHIATLTPVRAAVAPTPIIAGADEDAAMESLRQRFLDRLQASELSLSLRETEVCVGLLAGLTVPQLAERLELKVSTVESYFKRAAVKMGIGGRSPLLRWLHATDTKRHPAAGVYQKAV
ncbi:LuxR family transcriptional regulator [Pseudomonas cichorii]|uniref:Helix-turn-helix transcriptional regulator n=1 Tax=Pseudomonas serbiensis TaxID=3064350 RepID=A0ABT9CWW4_9PSED|nr:MULTISPECIES: helix-turn-helix transcriptional regulator [Pseudomonas]MDO7929920.1 helix-turn-helix transcriptional regulator [Pseudomonas sp. KFB-138]UXB94746.1 helix-turn-helix transcriptional regulator [Pseudomonas cichorii]GFM84906.1 LuxR family transcriptional regulator [Pseudomonas cichorii]